MCKNISRGIAMLRAGFKIFSKPIKLMIYYAYISSHLYYSLKSGVMHVTPDLLTSQ